MHVTNTRTHNTVIGLPIAQCLFLDYGGSLSLFSKNLEAFGVLRDNTLHMYLILLLCTVIFIISSFSACFVERFHFSVLLQTCLLHLTNDKEAYAAKNTIYFYVDILN